MSIIRKIIGFLPVLIPAFGILITVTPFTETEALYTGSRLAMISWENWVWLLLSLSSGILLCFSTLIFPGLGAGAVPYLYILIHSFFDELNGAFCLRFAVFGLLFYVLYTVCYMVYHRELNCP